MPDPRAATDDALASFGRARWAPPEDGLSLEWLETDGEGGYASSTVLLCPSRRYHGLLVATPEGQRSRHVFLTRYEEVLRGPGQAMHLSTGRYPGTWHPDGYQALCSFSLEPHPVARYERSGLGMTREVLRLRGSPGVLVRYTATNDVSALELSLRPLLAFRDAHALTFENPHLDPSVLRRGDEIVVRPYPELPALAFRVGGGDARFEAAPCWYRRVELLEERARGFDAHEDAFSPGWIHVALRPGEAVVVAAALDHAPADPGRLFAETLADRRAARAALRPGLRGLLDRAADDFLVRAPGGRTGVVAGYPWFSEWGRDTAISIPGLLLARGRVAEAAAALEGLLPYLSDGALPNVLGGTPAASSYGAADAALWFASAVGRLERVAGEPARVVRAFRAALEEIALRHLSGTSPVRADREGLLVVGSADANVTWMDARVHGRPVTPRDGCPVEVNALWYQMLHLLVRFARAEGDAKAARRFDEVRRRARRAFLDRFWMPEAGHLADVWKDGVQDASVRPNMVIAAALDPSPLTRRMRASILAVADARLLTPRGLRTLAPDDPRYRGRYEGGPADRDGAYHQGTVWPWLLGFYVEASLRAHGATRRRRTALRALIDAFRPHVVDEAGLLQVSEAFDGDAPHRPRGAVAQAWSVGELLRALSLLEDGVR